MGGASYHGTVSGMRVTEAIKGASQLHPNYPLLPGDILLKNDDGSWFKFGPGLGIDGFTLTAEQEASLEPVESLPFGVGGLDYFLGDTP